MCNEHLLQGVLRPGGIHNQTCFNLPVSTLLGKRSTHLHPNERLLGPAGWAVDIVESHHDRKKDAPSGTALALAKSLEEGGMPVSAARIHAIRAGDTIGEHEIRLAGPSERIHLMHQAVTRDLFAAGALKAATWLSGRGPGWYSMDDVLGTP